MGAPETGHAVIQVRSAALCKWRHTTGHRTIASVRMLPSNGGMKKSQRHGPLEPP